MPSQAHSRKRHTCGTDAASENKWYTNLRQHYGNKWQPPRLLKLAGRGSQQADAQEGVVLLGSFLSAAQCSQQVLVHQACFGV